MRHPGIEPGPPRWQRGIITTRLMTRPLHAKSGAKGDSNPRPLAPEARIIPLDHWPAPVAHGQKVTSGFEPLTTGSAILCSATELRNHSIEKESRQPDSNRRPLPYEGSAMTAMLCRRFLERPFVWVGTSDLIPVQQKHLRRGSNPRPQD